MRIAIPAKPLRRNAVKQRMLCAAIASNIATIKMETPDQHLESHAIGCIIIVGRTPSSAPQQKAFELYRTSFKDVAVLTFDELLERLVMLHDYLVDVPSLQKSVPSVYPEDSEAPF